MCAAKTLSEAKGRIKALRLQMLVHSYLYYVLDESLISDGEWQRRANELADLQNDFPVRIGCYDSEFRDWDASTGYHLPRDGWVHNKSLQLLRYARQIPPTSRRRIVLL